MESRLPVHAMVTHLELHEQLSTVSILLFISYWVVVALNIVFTSHVTENNKTSPKSTRRKINKNEERCRDGMPKNNTNKEGRI